MGGSEHQESTVVGWDGALSRKGAGRSSSYPVYISEIHCRSLRTYLQNELQLSLLSSLLLLALKGHSFTAYLSAPLESHKAGNECNRVLYFQKT